MAYRLLGNPCEAARWAQLTDGLVGAVRWKGSAGGVMRKSLGFSSPAPPVEEMKTDPLWPGVHKSFRRQGRKNTCRLSGLSRCSCSICPSGGNMFPEIHKYWWVQSLCEWEERPFGEPMSTFTSNGHVTQILRVPSLPTASVLLICYLHPNDMIINFPCGHQ